LSNCGLSIAQNGIFARHRKRGVHILPEQMNAKEQK
jgi:hypothetical protein